MSAKDEKREQIEAAVRSCYSTWGTSYYRDYYGPGAPYPPVHVDLLRRLVLESGAKTVLDAGCGPASFLRHLAGDRLELFGFDLTAEMVDEGKRVFGELVHADDLLVRAGEARPKLVAALEAMQSQFRMDLPPVRRGKAGEPGYDEVVSRTHNPLTVRGQFEAAGFRDVRVLFYHFHVVPPSLAATFPEFFLRESLAIENSAD